MHHAPIPARTGRHFGMDWLRIAAFGLLIVYHIGMVFSPWPWIIKATPTAPALIAPLALLTPWRLPLLFAVSGYASQALLRRSGGIAPFLRQRAWRLLLPLAFGMAVLVPIEMWVRVRLGGYPHGYLRFWVFDYWRTGSFDGVLFPSWEHLWFIAYLAAYTLVLGVLMLAQGDARARSAARWLARGDRLLWVPLAGLVGARLMLLFVVPEAQGLTTDWSGHAEYLPMFLLGALVARGTLWPAIARVRWPALGLAMIAGSIVVAVEIAYPGAAIPPHTLMALERGARVAMAWAMVLLLFHLAETRLGHDHPWRAPFAAAVFPAYLVHHTAIVLGASWLLPLGLPHPVTAVLLLAITVLACWSAWRLGRTFPLIGTAIGLAAPRPKAPVPA